jgi:RNA polymerase sigma-70 factor (ECF subfamily)
MSLAMRTPAPIVDISDAALMERLATGDVDALGPLHARYSRQVTSLLLRVEPSITHEIADDLTQDVFLTLLETAHRYQEAGRLRAWLFGIAVRKARGWRRRVWFRRSLLARERRPRATPAADARVEARLQTQWAMSQLTSGQREVLTLHVIEGLSGRDAAAALGIAEGAVWVRLHRARKALRAALAAQEVAP